MFIILKELIVRILSLLLSLLSLVNISAPCVPPEKPEYNTEYAHVLVHGLMGWGSYDFYYDAMPYWGMLGGDAVEKLRCAGFECYAASVAPTGSAWDRACELYAQLTGTRVDYGKAHSEKYGHERYGTDYTGRPLMAKEWNAENKINLYGHSFGGVTVRLLAELMQNGSEEERAATAGDSLSELFTGGKGDWIYSITALTAPHNGTSAYESEQWAPMSEDAVRAELEKVYSKLDITVAMFNFFVGMHSDENGAIRPDNAHYDLRIDNAIALNESISTLPDVYYFSYAACATKADENGNHVPTAGEIEPMFYTRSIGIGKNTFVTEAGHVIDEKWLPNDGLVNTYSALAPLNAPQVEYNADNVQKGVWNVMPIFDGDHTAFMGDLLFVRDIVPFFEELFTMINML
ncbi:MAG: esterase/lipase family protein [Acutalibacteraceae bacterium]